jgi:hypothetical protein
LLAVFRYLCRRFLKSGDDGEEMVHAVTDISTLSQTVKAADTSRHSGVSEAKTKREISTVSDVDSDRTSTAAPSPTSQTPIGRAFPPSPPTTIDREYASDSGDEAEPDSPRRGRKSEVDADDRDVRSKRRGSTQQTTRHSEHAVAEDFEESPRRAPSGRDMAYSEEEDFDEADATGSPDAPKLMPSKRRTNGKKTHPSPECVVS